MASLADKKKALDWSNRNAQGFQGILDVNQFLPVTGDIQSGVMAAQDLQKGNYGSAALNSLGLLPFVPALGAITAFHGSPAQFEKFDLSKIGSGAGNEYYGRGVYFTESPELAKSYAIPDSLESMFAMGTAKELKDAFSSGGIKKVDNYIKSNNLQKYAPDINKFFQSTVYKVDIPDKSIPKMLDFEKPLYRQSDEVKKVAMEYAPALKNRLEFTGGDSIWNLTGSDLFGAMQRYNPGESNTVKGITSESISNMLLSKGIPGSKYMDKSSAAKNYVVFDPNTVKILERNGLLLP